MASLFAVVAFLIGLFSFLFVSQATVGVAGLCFSCLIAILARMGQAEAQHRDLMATLTPPAGAADAKLAPFDFPREPPK